VTPKPPSFGKRGLIGAPAVSRPPALEPAPRRMRSNAVAVGAVSLFALGFTGATAYQEYHCSPPARGQPDTRPSWCFRSGYGHSSAGHGWGFGSVGSSVGHASFGGFGAHGSGHGGGS
jgi:hypothetical protein